VCTRRSARLRAVRGWTRLPVDVSGGFSATDYAIIDSAEWDIMIVGRSVAEAVRPAQAANEIVKLVHQRRVR
jgi:3-keto-L-gulonate-6-phosphate decarboxylase